MNISGSNPDPVGGASRSSPPLRRILPSLRSIFVTSLRFACAAEKIPRLPRVFFLPLMPSPQSPGPSHEAGGDDRERNARRTPGEVRRVLPPLTPSDGDAQRLRRTLGASAKQRATTPFFRLDRFTLINRAHVVSYQRKSRDQARLQLNGMKEPLLLGRRAILRWDKAYHARPAQCSLGRLRV